MLDLYLSEGLVVHANYNGHRNKLDAYNKKLDIHKFNMERGDYDEFIGTLDSSDEIDVVLMDMPGQILPEFIKFERDTCLLEGLYSIGYRVVFLNPISYRQDCLYYLKQLIEEFKGSADYVIVKNECFGKNFPYFDVDIQSNITSFDGIIMQLPALSKFVYSRLEEAACIYSDGAAKKTDAEISKKLGVVERSLIFNWLHKFRKNIYSDKNLLKYFGLAI
ncbi:unknown protein (plasmid) [Calothrix sp. PCC 7716]|nr:unknown protein [Calothrix sp. PCC 7716]